MSDQDFEVRVRRQADHVILDLSGLIDGRADKALTQAYREGADGATGPVLLNFSDVKYINSTGIALVVTLLAEARRSHRTVRACGLSDHYREIFEITRLSDFMPIFADESSAVAAGA